MADKQEALSTHIEIIAITDVDTFLDEHLDAKTATWAEQRELQTNNVRRNIRIDYILSELERVRCARASMLAELLPSLNILDTAMPVGFIVDNQSSER